MKMTVSKMKKLSKPPRKKSPKKSPQSQTKFRLSPLQRAAPLPKTANPSRRSSSASSNAPLRRRLPDTRMGKTHKFNVAGHEGYLTVGLYEDGTPGELFITMAKEGSTIGGLMDSLGTAISVALQYGVPVESLVNKFTHQRFEPAGITHKPRDPVCQEPG